jgi:hypothetical protein
MHYHQDLIEKSFCTADGSLIRNKLLDLTDCSAPYMNSQIGQEKEKVGNKSPGLKNSCFYRVFFL